MILKVIEILTGPENARVHKDVQGVLSGRIPLMWGDNIRCDIDGSSLPGGLEDERADEVTWEFFFENLETPDITVPGNLFALEKKAVVGRYFQAAGNACRNLERSKGRTINVKHNGGEDGTRAWKVRATARGESAEVIGAKAD